MIPLHMISREMTANIWATLVGVNGQHLMGGVAHLFTIPRGTPPPMDSPYDRLYWHPWRTLGQLSFTERKTPLCGPLNTTSRRPGLMPIGTTDIWTIKCLNCEAIDGQARSQNQIRATDPWEVMRRQAQTTNQDGWWLQPDPVSGL